MRPISTIIIIIILVVRMGGPIRNHGGQGHSGTTGRSEWGHSHNIVNVGGGIARVLVAIRIYVYCGTGGIPFRWGRYLGHHTGVEANKRRGD